MSKLCNCNQHESRTRCSLINYICLNTRKVVQVTSTRKLNEENNSITEQTNKQTNKRTKIFAKQIVIPTVFE
jgi:hypothetical protein